MSRKPKLASRRKVEPAVKQSPQSRANDGKQTKNQMMDKKGEKGGC